MEKKKEKEKDKVKGITLINRIYYEATSPDMILLLFLSLTNNSMTVLPSKYAQYLQQKLLLRRDLRTSASNLDGRDGKDPNCPIPDPKEQILNNQDELNVLDKERKLLKIFYRRLLRKGDQEQIRRFQGPRAFNHILQTMVTERI